MFWKRKQKPDPLLSEVVSTLSHLSQAIEGLRPVQEESAPTSLGLAERQDSLENRFEELRGTCLRHLQSASQRLARADQLHEEMEDEGELPTTVPIQQPIPEEHDPVNGLSDLEFVKEKIRAGGGQPII